MPAADAAVVHPHEGVVLEWVAVCVGESSFCCCAHVREDEIRACLCGETLEVLAVPGGDGGCEYAGLWAEFWVGVEADAEAVAVYGAAVVLFSIVNRRKKRSLSVEREKRCRVPWGGVQLLRQSSLCWAAGLQVLSGSRRTVLRLNGWAL